jgi:BirA family biotin operon repressor/biotin-[acetyl-CoA-carboxylase] ligase
MLASLAVVYSIEDITGLKAELKWPNDILVGNRKVCGILVETELKGSRLEYTIIGIGLNANVRLADYPEIPSVATSLADELGREVPYLDLLRRLIIEADRLYSALPSVESIYEQWRNRLVTLGRGVVVEWGDMRYTGIAESVARDGSLLLRRADGSLVRVVAGEVTLRDYTNWK